MWGNEGIRETTVVTADAPGGIAGPCALLHVDQTALDNASAIRVCQPGPVAFQRANVSGGNRIEIDVRALPDFGRPRGFNILAADAAVRRAVDSADAAQIARYAIASPMIRTRRPSPAFYF